MLRLRCLLMALTALLLEVQFSEVLSSNNLVKEKRETQQLAGNVGNEFYIGFMENYIKPAYRNIGVLIINRTTIFIATTDPLGVVTMIESEQGTSTLNVSVGTAAVKKISHYKAQSSSDRNKGVKIKAEQSKQISIFGLNEELRSVEGFTALPCNHLPSVSRYEYYAVSVPPSTISNISAESSFLIVACSDNTTLTVTPSQSIVHPNIPDYRVRAGDTISITLHERETLYIQSREDLTGSKVESTVPISFFTGHECGNVPADTAECDHLVEQIPPTVTWGTQFIIAPTATRMTDDLIKVVAAEEYTYGHLSCISRIGVEERSNFTISNTIKYYEFRLSSDKFCFVETNEPVLVVQFTPGGSADGVDGDPFMVIVPAVSQYLENTTFTTANGIGLNFDNYINIFVSAGPNEFDSSTILVDGSPITTDNWVAIPCFDDDRTCGHATTVNITEGMHSVWNEDDEAPIGVTVYGLSYLETYAYVGGLKLSLPGLDPDISPSSYLVLSGSSICIPCRSGNENPQHGTRFEWSRGGMSLQQTKRLRVASDGALCIDNATFSDADNYTCYMSGEPYPSQLSVISGIIVEPPNCGSTDRGAVTGVGQDTVYLNTSIETLQVCCRVQGPPETTVTWLLDGVPITDGMRDYEFGEDYIRYSGPMKIGCMTFTCQANFTADIPVVFESSEICIGNDRPPTFVSITGKKSVLEYSSASYHCSADGYPRPRKVWTAHRDMDEFLPRNATDYGNGTLTISSVTEMDGRHKYCCHVSNEHGQLYNCTNLNVLIPPEIVKGVSSPVMTVSIPFGATLPLETPLNFTIFIGQNVMIPEMYNLYIKCMINRENPKASISWFRDTKPIQGLQYTVQNDGTLVIEGLARDRDDGVYTCVANTPEVGRDESSSTVNVTVPPQINSSKLVNSPGNCWDLTQDLQNTEQVGLRLCVIAGPSAELTLKCDILDGIPTPDIKWLKDGTLIAGPYNQTSFSLTLSLPSDASNAAKREIEGNYSCVAVNAAGIASVSSYVTLFGDIPIATATTEFVEKQSDVYHQLHKTVSEHFPGVQDGDQHLMFLTSGKILSYEDFDPGYKYDGSEESVLPQTMENIFDLVDIVPNGGSIAFNSYDAERLQETYSELIEMLQVAPSNLTLSHEIRQYLQETVEDLGSDPAESLPRLSLYLKYKNSYYMTVFEVEDLIESQRQSLHSWEFTQWYERNIERLNMKKYNEYMKWKMFADKEEVEEKLSLLKLEDHLQEVNNAHALLLASKRKSRFKDEKRYYLVKLYPDTWYKGLQNRVKESIHQMQYQLTQLKTDVQILEITSRYLDKEMEKRETLNALFPSLDPILKLYCDLDVATYQLEQIVRESEDMRYECLITGSPADCHLYWNLQEYIHDQVLVNYTEFYWYVHTVQAALDHRKYSIPAISSTITNIQAKIYHIQTSINIALSELADRDKEETNNNRDFLSDFTYKPDPSFTNYSFTLPPSLVGRLLWYINPESTELLSKDMLQDYNLTFNHLNTAFTNISAKLMTVNIHRRWFKSVLFGNKHLTLKNPDIMVSPGAIKPPQDFRNILQDSGYRLPLYPSSMLLATEIELTVDVPYVFHTLPTLIKLSYDPHVSGGFGPFSFGPLYRASAGNMKFKVGIKENKIVLTIPGTQLIGYVCDVVPKHPTKVRERSRRSMYNFDSAQGESEFDQWLFSKRNNPSTEGRQFIKETGDETQQYTFHSLTGREDNNEEGKLKKFEMLIAPSLPLKDTHSYSQTSERLYHFSTNTTTMRHGNTP